MQSQTPVSATQLRALPVLLERRDFELGTSSPRRRPLISNVTGRLTTPIPTSTSSVMGLWAKERGAGGIDRGTACGAKSALHFDVQGSVAKSTHAGILWPTLRQDSGLASVSISGFDG
jgi:hypothetical protein